MSDDTARSTMPVGAVDGIRCSNAEREEVRATLYAAAGEGRLTMDEVEERLGRLEELRFRHELAGLTADLPASKADETTGWRPVLAAARRALLADFAVLLGRASEPASGRRRLLILITGLIGLLIAAAIVVGAVHGFGADEFSRHAMEAGEHGHGG
ncbi:DUF1707 domain-containing protein [Amycolatopsis balhimycina DSM 5908]|uniref:DUF1707 domain-containing protein n=1 Tax=Amycolatopsis balhimycina DSM 5908 TaxID=1081091 RepID=A0A428W4C8_AMYBA|nr:DUF1707 domain-containing protein [Amycolatopsis balhimycina]RSM37948.1 DUF1707 domain-containing protein [Amycolatopsis balhimycina DSM 5908]